MHHSIPHWHLSSGEETEHASTERKAVCEITQNDNGDEIFKCLACGGTYNAKHRFTEHYKHMHMKLKNKTFPCKVCGIPLLPHRRYAHLETAHGHPAPTCNICGRKFSAPHLVLRHQRQTHMGERNYKCDICSKMFFNRTHLKKHQITHSDVREYACAVCESLRYLSLLGPNREEALISNESQFCNVLITREGEKKYACTLCVKQFDIRKSLNAHYKTVHLRLYPTKKTHPCVICKEEVIPRNRWRHMEERHGWNAPTCPDCGRKFSYPFQVPVHQREVHNPLENLTYVCEHCGDQFPSMPRLRQHEIKHLDVKNYKCDQCPKAFKTITYLKQHMVRHSGVKGHICDECGAAFYNYKDLYSHVTGTHATEKNFKCQFCSKCFKTRRLLNVHEKIHTGDKKHKCPVCEKAYVQSNNLKYHIRSHHPEKLIETEKQPK
ncbi:zinc finger protein 624-like [Cydia amplana]|uniref:zinc finger protein 624-like n=1 Tax=Cydia amplana TaxID=1869771 RepID=UPI002FE59E3E